MNVDVKYQKESIKVDHILSQGEKNYLRAAHSDIIKNKEQFAKDFGLKETLKSLQGCKTVLEVGKRLNWDMEKIALLQAYLFDEVKQIDGILGDRTLQKIKNHLQYRQNPTPSRPMKPNKPVTPSRPHPNKPTNTIDQNKTKEEIYLSKFRSLDDGTYNRLFLGGEKIGQGKLGDCYMITAINMLSRCPYFDTLMKTSLKIVDNNPTIYQLKMPLGEPQGQPIFIHQEEVNLAFLKGNIGYKLLEIGYAKYALHQPQKRITTSEIQRIAGGISGFALQNFLGAKSLEGFSYTGRGQSLGKMKENDKINMTNLLKSFNLSDGQGFLTVGTLPGSSDRKSYSVGGHTLYHSHAYAITNVEKQQGMIKSITVLNPRNTATTQGGSKITMSLNDFFSAFGQMDVGRITSNFLNLSTNRNEVTLTDNPNRRKKKNEKRA